MQLSDILPATIWQILFVFIRVGAATMMLPGFGEAYVPGRMRIIFSMVLTLLIVPVVLDIIPPLPDNPLELFLIIAGEIAIGVFIGLIAQVLLSTLQTAGTIIAFMMSLANALAFNPATAQQSSTIGSFLGAVGLLLIFMGDLHHLMLAAVVDSYTLFIPGQMPPVGDFSEIMTRIVAGSFTVALQFSAPWILVGLIFYLGLGLLARLMPQVQIFFVAIPIQLLIGFALFLPVLALMGFTFLSYYQSTLERFLAP
ncbi:MAG: flagellar biosynthetic protein FliR [Pseudomonadota bacterium]